MNIIVDGIQLFDWRTNGDYWFRSEDLKIRKDYWGDDQIVSSFKKNNKYYIYFCGFYKVSKLHAFIHKKYETSLIFDTLQLAQEYADNFLIKYNKLQAFE